MKFLHLKEQLEKVFPTAPPQPKREPRTITAYKPIIVDRVVGGDIKWKPVNKQAAMILAKAPWWAMPPIENKTNEIRNSNKRGSVGVGQQEVKNVAQPNGKAASTKDVLPKSCLQKKEVEKNIQSQPKNQSPAPTLSKRKRKEMEQDAIAFEKHCLHLVLNGDMTSKEFSAMFD